MNYKFNYKKKYGYGCVEYKSKLVDFGIFEDDSGYATVKDRKLPIFHKDDAKHKHRIQSIKQAAKELRRKARLLDEAALIMMCYHYNTPVDQFTR